MKDNQSISGGMSFWSVLQLIFIVLKLCNVITWSWWVVFTPLWISLGIGLVIIIFFLWLRKKYE